MSRFELWSVRLGTWLVGGTGLVYGWMLYFLEPADPYSVVHHPLQPALQHAHVLAAPLLVFALGMIVRDHAWRGLRSGVPTRRRSGVVLLAAMAPMILSGYLLQTATEEPWRQAWRITHGAAGVLWLAGYVGHRLARGGRRWRFPQSRPQSSRFAGP